MSYDTLTDPDDETSPELILDLDHSSPDLRYDPQVELYLYRIVQQACANALQHASAGTISVRGCLSPDSIVCSYNGFHAQNENHCHARPVIRHGRKD